MVPGPRLKVDPGGERQSDRCREIQDGNGIIPRPPHDAWTYQEISHDQRGQCRHPVGNPDKTVLAHRPSSRMSTTPEPCHSWRTPSPSAVANSAPRGANAPLKLAEMRPA